MTATLKDGRFNEKALRLIDARDRYEAQTPLTLEPRVRAAVSSEMRRRLIEELGHLQKLRADRAAVNPALAGHLAIEEAARFRKAPTTAPTPRKLAAVGADLLARTKALNSAFETEHLADLAGVVSDVRQALLHAFDAELNRLADEATAAAAPWGVPASPNGIFGSVLKARSIADRLRVERSNPSVEGEEFLLAWLGIHVEDLAAAPAPENN